jgi:single-strand DNA-binding protein
VHEPFLTVVGHVGGPPRSRVLASGAVVTDFRIASTPRRVDRATGVWSDGETLWFGVSCWRQLAENVASCVRTGDRVVVTGHLRSHTWRTEQGEERSRLEVDAQTVAFDLSRGRVVQERTPPSSLAADAESPDEPREPAPDVVDGKGSPAVVQAQVGAA